MFDTYETRPAPRPGNEIDFSQAKPGSSLWVATNEERLATYNAFKRWKARTGSSIEATSFRVDNKDQRGPGYRIAFERGAVDLKPGIKAIICMFSNGHFDKPGGEPARHRMERTGIMSDDDILDALADEGETISTIGHAKAFRSKLIMGSTRYQVAWCRSMGLPTIEEAAAEYQEQQRREAAERRSQAIGKPEARRPAPPAGMWRELTADDRAAMRAEGVGTAELFAEAWATFPPTWTDDAVIEAIAEGQGEWHAYRTRLAAMGETTNTKEEI